MKSSHWQKVSLGDVCDVIAGGTPSRKNPKYFGGDIPWVKISDMLQGLITFTDEAITKAGLENSAAKILPSGTVLISIFATIGRTAVLGIDAATNQAIVGVIPKSETKLNTSFLRYSLDNSILELTKEARGVAQVNINGKILKSLKIPLPPLPEQERIVRLLDEAESLRATRERANARMEQFVPALFHEMFGDQAKEKWGYTTLGEVCLLVRDGTHKTPTYVSEGVPFVTVKNIVTGSVDFTNTKFVTKEEHVELSKRVKPEFGDVLVSKDGTIGVPCIVDTQKEFSIFVSVILLKLKKEKIDPQFLVHQINSEIIQNQISENTKGIAIRHLHLEDARKLKLVVPPLALQREFAARVREARGVQSAQARSVGRIEALYQSMLSRAFAGEL
jgi:type I restriction enzyme S subunit